MKNFVIGFFKGIFLTVLLVNFIFVITLFILIKSNGDLTINVLRDFLVKDPTIEKIELKGVGVLGDSQSDEYRADDKRGSNYPDSTYNWVELLAKERGINFGEWSYYEEPRRQGFEYNFARSGATAQTMIDQGQHTGLEKYIKDGKVNLVIIYIGANDYAPYLYDNAYQAIYNGELSESNLIEKRNNIIVNIKTAIDTAQISGAKKIFVTTIPDWGSNPSIKIAFPDFSKRFNVNMEIYSTNQQIVKLAEGKNVEIIDINEFYRDLRDSEDGYKIKIEDEEILSFLPQNNPRSMFLSDGVHPGTVLNALFANYIVENINPHLENPISPLSNEEILKVIDLN